MTSDRERWDLRHTSERGSPPRAPDAFVVEVLDRLGPGAGRSALDVACGTGRHSLLLAERGWDTRSWDVSPVGLAILAERAHAKGLRIETRLVDLAAAVPAERELSLVIVVDYLDRDLFGRLGRLVRPGGDVVIATFTEDWPATHPSPRFRLRRGELGDGVPGLLTVAHRESQGRVGLWGRAREDS